MLSKQSEIEMTRRSEISGLVISEVNWVDLIIAKNILELSGVCVHSVLFDALTRIWISNPSQLKIKNLSD